MTVLSSLACLVDHHEPLRRKVEWDGRHYVGQCRNCDAAITRRGRYWLRRWRKLPATDK